MGNVPCRTIKTVTMQKIEPVADIALIGLAVMGQNLILNMNDHGWVVVAHNRSVEKVDDFLASGAKGTKVIGAHSIEEMVAKLKKPRRVMMLVKAGAAVDSFIEKLVPLLEKGDIIIDGGNSEYQDTQRRCQYLAEKGLLFVGSGVSGGEEGARYGPSLMPGGHKEAWPHIKDIFQSIAARSNDEPCCDWVGEDGAGHYVKMVHNGIEYGDMQLICEAYHLMKSALGMTPDEMSEVSSGTGRLDSFLIEITANILAFKDEDGKPLVEKIRDAAGQKGTGKWTAISGLDYGVPTTLIAESVFARCLSALKRCKCQHCLDGPEEARFTGDKKEFIEQIRMALYASKIVSYAQGFMLLREAAAKFGWNLNYGGIALMWAALLEVRLQLFIKQRRFIWKYLIVFLGNIREAFEKNPQLNNLLIDDFFKQAVGKCQAGWRAVVAQGALLGIPTPALSSALAFYDGYPGQLLQANLDSGPAITLVPTPCRLPLGPGKFTTPTGLAQEATCLPQHTMPKKFLSQVVNITVLVPEAWLASVHISPAKHPPQCTLAAASALCKSQPLRGKTTCDRG
ncbi:6-phosphogluconate dehydrogenase, decarboxylating-like [Penaeus japonicus]|uniref:6-phosphogluconate dehydrogenase, decarboxylating-like n=1 Tax=Penaeus japonicus TaxID=27405 RepID=UPI001C70D5D9|nr:6-phosphogluconate dehydrogenase, decarboxylating-like [Penaeus japonicus]